MLISWIPFGAWVLSQSTGQPTEPMVLISALDLREFSDGFRCAFFEKRDFFGRNVFRNERTPDRIFAVEFGIPDKSLQITAAVVQMNVIAEEVFLAGLLVLLP